MHEPTPGDDQTPLPATGRLTARSVLLGLALAALNAYWVVLAEVRWGIMDGSCLPLFITPVFLIFLVVLGNLALRRWRPRAAFSQAELLAVYLLIVGAETLAAHDLVQNLFGALGHAYWFATPENKWADLFHKYLPQWLVVSDLRALKLFYEGGASFLDPWALTPFVVPLLGWGVMLAALMGTMLAANVLVRQQWIRSEKLSYPLVLLPLELTRQQTVGRPFFRDPLMWGGLGLAVAIDLLNGLHVLQDAVPTVPLVKLVWPTFREIPWKWMYRFSYGVYPFAVALAFFIPSDLSFSCWFFFLTGQVQLLAAGYLGALAAPPQGFPYLADQASGAWLALALGSLVTTRRHLAHAWRLAWGTPEERESPEGRLYRQALVGGLLCLAVLVACLYGVGMGPGLIAGFLGIFGLISLAITRVRAEFGTPHEIYYINPQRLLVSTVGARALGPRQLTALSVVYWFNRGYRSHPMPFQLESMKLAEVGGLDLKGLLRLLILAAVAGILMAYWANLDVTFREGAQAKCMAFKAWVGGESFTRLDQWLHTLPPPSYASLVALAVGGLTFWAFRWVHFNTALPLHPAGYALANSFAMNYFWCSFLVGWTVKVLVLRYAGRSGHSRAVRFFLGLLLGDYVMGSIWGALGPLLGIRTYKNFI